MQTTIISQAMMTASVVAVQMATSEEDATHLTPAELQQTIESGMTKDALVELSSINKVYIEMTELDAAIDALANLKAEEEPETKPYDLADLKNRIGYKRTQTEKHMAL